jgi:hypothetical protein
LVTVSAVKACRGIFRRVLVSATLALLLTSCDHGGVLILDNRSDADLVVQVSGTIRDASSSTIRFQPRQDVVSVPAHERLAIAVLPFTDPFDIHKVDVLTPDCVIVASFDTSSGTNFASEGYVIVVERDRSAHIQRDFPETGALAPPIDRCVS